jgi:Protein of unknown function (DUF4019)
MTSKLPLCSAFLVVMVHSGLAAQGEAQQSSAGDGQAKTVREVNIASDSAPGWVPSKTDEQQVILATKGYFLALDSREYERAYEMMAPINKQSLPYPQFMEQSRSFHDQAGSVLRRSTLKITWTKDPANAPFPGVYAAVDVSGKFTNVDRECGYIVFYQKPTGVDFQVMRVESNHIDNATAQSIERTKSRAAFDEIWSTLSANCPNYASSMAD